MKKILAISGALVLVLVLLGACQEGTGGKAAGKVLAEVNGEKITEADFNAELEGKPDFYKQYAQSENGKKQILDKLIERKLLLQIAEKEKVADSPEVLSKVEEYRARVITEKLKEKVLTNQAEVTEEEIKEYYDSHPDQFNPPEQYRLRQIVLDDAKTANQVLKEAKAKPDQFNELAKKYSVDEKSKNRGGEMGFVKKGMLPPELENKVFKLKEDEISPVLNYQGKYYIFQMVQKRMAEHKELEEVKDAIKNRLSYEKKQNAWREYLDTLKKNATIKYLEQSSAPAK